MHTALGIGLAILVVLAAPAGAIEKVHFEAAVLPPSPLKLRLAAQQGVTLEPEVATPLWGYLAKPVGAGPFAAVVMLHGCSGLPPGGPPTTDWLTEQGFVTLMVDSLGPRSLDSGCFGDIGAAERVLDAYGAADYLSGLPFVDGERLAVMGWSQGGSTALDAVLGEGIGQPLGRPFRAAVAVSPWCGYAKALYAPTLILTGEADEWTHGPLLPQDGRGAAGSLCAGGNRGLSRRPPRLHGTRASRRALFRRREPPLLAAIRRHGGAGRPGTGQGLPGKAPELTGFTLFRRHVTQHHVA